MLEPGAAVTWHWDIYAASAQVFSPRSGVTTFVNVPASGFTGGDDEKTTRAIVAMGGFSLPASGCKAFLEQGVTRPGGQPTHSIERRTAWNSARFQSVWP